MGYADGEFVLLSAVIVILPFLFMFFKATVNLVPGLCLRGDCVELA